MIRAVSFGDVTQFIMARVENGQPVYIMACYYVDGLLVDSGPTHVAGEIEDAFRGFPVRILVNTHHHEDHISNNIVFQEKMGVGPALAHPLAVPRIANPSAWAADMPFYRQYAWGEPPASRAHVIPPSIRTPRYEFEVVHTPGHSDDHICLLEPRQKWLFAGDIFLSDRIVVLRADEDVYGIMDSLKLLLQYDFDTLFCASGKVFFDAHRLVSSKLDYLTDLGQKVLQLHHQGVAAEDIRDQLLGAEGLMYQMTDGDFAKLNLVRSFLDH